MEVFRIPRKALIVLFVAVTILHSCGPVSGGMLFQVERSMLPGPEYPLAGLPLFDEQTKGWRILGHPFVLKFQLRCLLLGAPCDVIGRWLKPRIEKILLEGKCELCTASQFKKVNDWVNQFVEKHPEMWRAAMAKYADNLGIPIPPEERRKMIRVLGTYP